MSLISTNTLNLNIPYGVPLGSMIGRVVFLTSISESSSLWKFTLSIFFTDDSNHIENFKCMFDIEIDRNDELSEIVKCLKIKKA